MPQKEGKPYYDFTVPAPGAGKNELFHRAQLFLVEYFKKSTPEIKIADKEDGVLAAGITLFYSYIDNPNVTKGKTQCLLYVKAENGSCHVSVYDFTIYRQETEAGATRTAANGATLLGGHTIWNRENETALYQKAAGNDKRSLGLLEHVHDCVQKLQEALTKKLAG